MYIIKIGHEAPAEAEEAGRSGERAFEFEMIFSSFFEVMKVRTPTIFLQPATAAFEASKARLVRRIPSRQ